MKKKSIIYILGLLALIIALAVAIPAYHKNNQYSSAMATFENGDYVEAEKKFTALSGYKDADDYIMECKYQNAIADLDNGQYENALSTFEALEGYKDTRDYIEKALFERKYAMLDNGDDASPERLEAL